MTEPLIIVPAPDGDIAHPTGPHALKAEQVRDPDRRYSAWRGYLREWTADEVAAAEAAEAAAAIPQARAAKMGDLSARLGAMLAAGLPHSDGRVYPATERDQQRIAAIQTGIASGQGLPLGRQTLGKSHAGGIAELTEAEWTALATAMRDFVTAAVEAHRAHAAVIAGYATAAEIEAHDVTADIEGVPWPANAIDG